MANSVFTLEHFTDVQTKLNMDELFEKKRAREQKQLALFRKILNRVHARIKQCSRGFKPQTFCWFPLPNMIIGTANYDPNACIAYIIHHLQENDFQVKYYTPHTLLINWGHWVPSYIRAKIQQTTGVEVDKFGRAILDTIHEDDPDEEYTQMMKPQTQSTQKSNSSRSSRAAVSFSKMNTNTESTPSATPTPPPQKPNNNLIYSTEMLDTKLDFRTI